MKSANDMCDLINNPNVGVAVDVYHLWWDPELESEIARCGKDDRIFAFHVCGWLNPTKDLLLDRGLMGDGVIDIPGIRSMVEKGGFNGFNEVEIFSTEKWASDQTVWLKEVIDAYLAHV